MSLVEVFVEDDKGDASWEPAMVMEVRIVEGRGWMESDHDYWCSYGTELAWFAGVKVRCEESCSTDSSVGDTAIVESPPKPKRRRWKSGILPS